MSTNLADRAAPPPRRGVPTGRPAVADVSASDAAAADFQLARTIVGDLFEPNLRIYWTDFLISVAIGFSCFFAVRAPWITSLWIKVPLFFVACLALYRAVLFTHELAHHTNPRFRRFRLAWNLLIGIPFLMPSFTYNTHRAHHSRKHYGTRDDGEYLPLAAGPVWGLVAYFAPLPLLPIVAIVRFLVLTPLCWLLPRLRRVVQQRLSSMVIDPTYVRPLPTDRELGEWRSQEAACFLFTATMAGLLVAGRLPWSSVLLAYGIALVVMTINHVRTLGAHHFRHTGEQLTWTEQLLDSINYPNGKWLTELWAPVGLRYHALHHWFPAIPYHNLPEAHRRLMEQLPADSHYRQVNRPGLLPVLADLWRAIRHQ